MPITFSHAAVAQIRTAIQDQRAQVGGIRFQDPGEEHVYPQVLFARLPIGGIPARSGLDLGQAECELFSAAKPNPITSEARQLAPLLNPDNTRRKVTVSNLDATAIAGSQYGAADETSVYCPIWQHQGGAWFTVAVSDQIPSSSSGSADEPLYETDPRCEHGAQNIYKRSVTISFVGSTIQITKGPWTLDHVAGCCSCGDPSSSSSPDESSSSSPDDSSSSSPDPSSSSSPDDSSSSSPDDSSSSSPDDSSSTSPAPSSSSVQPISSVSSAGSFTYCPQGFCTFAWSAAGQAWVQQSGSCTDPANDPSCRCRTPAEMLAYEGAGSYDGETVYDYCGHT